MTRYGEYAGILFIAEGVGDIGVTAIRERIARHIDMTGQNPAGDRGLSANRSRPTTSGDG